MCLNAWVTITAAAENNATTYADIPEKNMKKCSSSNQNILIVPLESSTQGLFKKNNQKSLAVTICLRCILILYHCFGTPDKHIFPKNLGYLHQLFGFPKTNFGLLKRKQPHSPSVTSFCSIWTEGCQEFCN